ncbi:MAG TPA: GNAT family N-acetyltransferase [Terriglobales bacterium]|nr:GNAT family N-acetyltransferase [Terriglobales bacterium]
MQLSQAALRVGVPQPMPLLCPVDPGQTLPEMAAGAAEFEYEVITDFKRLEQLAPAWDRLWQSDPAAEIFQCFAWARAWWQAFGDNFKLRVLVLYQAREVVLILPLVLSGSTLRFLGSPEADYSDILCRHPRRDHLLSHALDLLLRCVPEWKECVLEYLRPDSTLLHAAAALPRKWRCRLQTTITDTCPTILLGERRDQVIDSLLAGKHLRRRVQKLGKAGMVTFRHIENNEEAQRHLTELFRAHQRRCAVLAKTSCFERPEMRSMIRALVAQLDVRREARLGVLELNGRPLAWSLGFQVNGKYAYYQQTFDVDAEEYAPGEVLLHHLLLYARSNVERELDFLRGDEFFKKRFATHVYASRTLYLQRPGVRGRLRLFARTLQARLCGVKALTQHVVRTHESFFRFFRSVWIWKRSTWRCLQRANQTGELSGYVIRSSAAWIWNRLWNRNVTTWFTSGGGNGTGVQNADAISDSKLTVTPGRLSELADLAREHPELSLPGLRACRERLKKGDRAHLVWQSGRVVLIGWSASRTVGATSAVLADGKDAFEMYECWPIRNPSDACPRLLGALASEASVGNRELLVCCPAVPRTSQDELNRQGFLAKKQTLAYRLFRCLHYERIRKGSAPGSPESAEKNSCPKWRQDN